MHHIIFFKILTPRKDGEFFILFKFNSGGSERRVVKFLHGAEWLDWISPLFKNLKNIIMEKKEIEQFIDKMERDSLYYVKTNASEFVFVFDRVDIMKDVPEMEGKFIYDVIAYVVGKGIVTDEKPLCKISNIVEIRNPNIRELIGFYRGVKKDGFVVDGELIREPIKRRFWTPKKENLFALMAGISAAAIANTLGFNHTNWEFYMYIISFGVLFLILYSRCKE